MPQILSVRHFVLVVGSNSDSREVASSDSACILDGPKRVCAGFPSCLRMWNVTVYLIVLRCKVNICGCQIVLVSAQLGYTFLYQKFVFLCVRSHLRTTNFYTCDNVNNSARPKNVRLATYPSVHSCTVTAVHKCTDVGGNVLCDPKSFASRRGTFFGLKPSSVIGEHLGLRPILVAFA